MFKFERSLDPDFVKALNKSDWWRKIVDNKNFFIGIRKNYLNVYHCGNSLIKLEHNKKGLVGKTHYKYLVKNRENDAYFDFHDGSLTPDYRDKYPLSESLSKDLPSMIKMAKRYGDEEKSGLHAILMKNKNIIDVEVAFRKESTKPDGRDGAERIDFAAFQKTGNKVELVFFEAKHFSNKELRLEEKNIPKVVNQIRRYEEQLKKHKTQIVSSYQRVVDNLLHMTGYDENKKAILRKCKKFSVNFLPKLVIFGYNQDQSEGTRWLKNRSKLIGLLGNDRVLLRGSPEKFSNGISF